MDNLFQVSLLTEEEIAPATEVVKTDEVPGAKKVDDTTDKPLIEQKKADIPSQVLPKTPEISIISDEEIAEMTGGEPGELNQSDEPITEPSVKDTVSKELDYKALAEAKLERGDWENIWDNWDEEKDKIEWTSELYLELEKEQIENKVSKAIEERTSSLPQRVKEITEFIKNGGKEEDLYSSFQQEVDIESLNPEDSSDAEAIITTYCESTDWTAEEIKDYIDGLKDKGSDALKQVAEKRKSTLINSIQEERKQEIEQQKRIAEETKIYWEDFQKKVRESIHKFEAPEREKKELEKFHTEYKYQDKQGNKFTEFGKRFEEARHNPEKWAKVLKFFYNPDSFEEKSKTEKETKKKIHNLLRSSQADLGAKTSEMPESVKNTKLQKGQFNPFSKAGV